MVGYIKKQAGAWLLAAFSAFTVCATGAAAAEGDAAQAANAPVASPTSQVAGPSGTDWLKDPDNGCAVFNIDPQPGKSIHWSGACKDGYAEGRGILQWQDGSGGNVIYHRGKLSGRFAYAWKNGFHYLGDWVDGKRHGKGVLTWPEGDRYEGDWVDGKRNGRGVLTKVNGEKQSGDWYDDKFIQ